MKKLLMVGLAAGALALNAPVMAHADGDGYKGGCRFSTVNDTTPGGQLGGQEQWTGQVNVAVVANTPTDTISASCYIKVNAVAGSTVLEASARVGATGAAGEVTFSAKDTDVVELCTSVTLNGNPVADVCVTSTVTQIVPEPVVEAIDLVITLLNDNVFSKIDPTICPILAAGAPGVGPIIINGEGDVWIGSTADTDKFWDCPPYDPPVV